MKILFRIIVIGVVYCIGYYQVSSSDKELNASQSLSEDNANIFSNAAIIALDEIIKPSMRDYVLNEWNKIGQRHIADEIIMCESSWRDDAINYNPNGSYDLGLYQINSIHKDISDECKLDYKCATKKAIELWKKNGKSWRAWVCYKKISMK